jgi:hypothetical protein
VLRSSQRRALAIAVSMCALACSLVVGADQARATISQFGEEGGGAGQFIVPAGVAVDQTSGNVYIVDSENSRVDKFDNAGGFLEGWGWGVADGTTQAFQTCTSTCFSGIGGAGPGQFVEPRGVAVDNSANPLDMSVGDIYVFDTENRRVEKFSPEGRFLLMFGGGVDHTTGANVCTADSGDTCGAGDEGTGPGQFGAIAGTGIEPGFFIAVDSLGTVYAGDVNRVEEFSPEGEYQSEIPLPGTGKITALAVNPSGDIYVTSQETTGVQEYDPSGTLINTLDSSGEPKALALDSSSDLFIDDGEGAHRHLLEYDSSGNEVDSVELDLGTAGGSSGIAFGESAGVLYVLDPAEVRVVTPPPPGPLTEHQSESASPIGPTTATLNAIINPEGHDTAYHFEYGPTASYVMSTPESASIGAGFEDQSASADLTNLQPATTYHFRVVASNESGGVKVTTYGPDETFATLPTALIVSDYVSNVAAMSVTFGAQINPLGAQTNYHFEYGPTESYGTSVPVAGADIGSGESDVVVSAYVQNLMADETYHYRVVASNERGGVKYKAESEDHTFTTEPAGTSLRLPDGRAWELVSPVDKHGAAIEAFNEGGAVIQASEDGDAITYAANGPTEASPPGTLSPERVQVLSRRSGDGWESHDIATPHNAPTAEALVGHESEYKLFSGDLLRGLVEAPGTTPLSAETSERTPYLRDDLAGSYTPLVTAANVPVGTKFGGNSENAVNEDLEVVSASPDLRHVVLNSKIPLTSSASISEGNSLYEWAGGKPQELELASVLPKKLEGEAGEPAPGPSLGYQGSIVRHAISNDGSRVLWESKGHLYMRDMDRSETTQLDAAEGAPPLQGSGRAQFQTASSDGSKVFFTDEQQLTSTAKPGREAPDLYEFEMTGADSGRLTDLTVDHNAREHAALQGEMLGASEDGSFVYFVAKGVLTSATNGSGETASDGVDNLYVLHRIGTLWSTTFIAKLSSEDANDWDAGPKHDKLVGLTSRVSPDGLWLAFMSDRSLTGYDNLDANSGMPDEEVFLYNESTDRLVCASCNPSGARPAGMFDTGEVPKPLVDTVQAWPQRWLAGSVPGWTPDSLADALYQSRYLSDSGRLLFDSADALVPQDTNGKEDVYEYDPPKSEETPASDTCTAESSTYSPRSGGCVALISSGSSGEESTFLDASESGDDVFFLTAARLAPEEDQDISFDVYDAHVCSAAAPCPAVTGSAPPPPCSTADSCRVAPSSQPAIFGAPPSATFSGAGNVTSHVSGVVVKPKSSNRSQKLSVALKACKKKSKKRRHACEKRAKRGYGSAPKVKKLRKGDK